MYTMLSCFYSYRISILGHLTSYLIFISPPIQGVFCGIGLGGEGEGFGHYENCSVRKIKGKKELTFVNASVKCFQ